MGVLFIYILLSKAGKNGTLKVIKEIYHRFFGFGIFLFGCNLCRHRLHKLQHTAARIGVFTTDNWQLENMLRIGYINISDFVKAGERMVNIFTALPWLKPFDMLGTNDERNRVAELFSEENGNILSEYFSRRAKMATELAKEYKFKALQNSDYANKQYALDMSRERLYAETDKRMR